MPHPARRRTLRSEIAPLERRLLMCVPGSEHASNLGSSPSIDQLAYHVGHDHAAGELPTIDADTVTPSASLALTEIPALHSRPTAPAKLYLDFDGDLTPTWGQYAPAATPAYDTDNDPLTFSESELANIREIWARVAEKYSPFNLDVTTQDPGNLADRQTLKVVIGGSGGWLNAGAGGVAYVGGFFSSWSPNSVFVFENSLANGQPKYVAEAIAHESGHGFGLQHQATWNGTNLTAEYSRGSGDGRAPIMGNSYSATRGLWWSGTPATSYSATQSDLSILAGANNGFGYRPDEFAPSFTGAAALTLSANTVTAAGVIEQTTDADTFSFTSQPGPITLTADVAAQGAMLDLKLQLHDAAGNLLASADTASLGESLTHVLPAAGTYYVTVASHGSYGDVGQYTLHGEITTAPAAVTPKPGDANLDGVVNFADLAILSQNYNNKPATTWADGDFNGDGVVDFQDLTTLAQNYSASPTAPVVQTASATTSVANNSQSSVSPRSATFSRKPIARASR